jgi:hypothetical protein
MAAGAPLARGRTLMRTVVGLNDDTAISTGLPPITMSVACPRNTPPDRATAAPTVAICPSASRRVIGWDMTRILPEARVYGLIDFSDGEALLIGGDGVNGCYSGGTERTETRPVTARRP